MSMPTCPSCIYAQGICEKTGVKIRYSTGCTYHTPKPITNADRIRAMTDDELAHLLGEFTLCENCLARSDACETEYDNPADVPSCEQMWLEWLKKEAKDG